MAKNIKTRGEDYAQWYLDVIRAAQPADHVCMVTADNDPLNLGELASIPILSPR